MTRRCQDIWNMIDNQGHKVELEHCKNWAVEKFKGKYYCLRHLKMHKEGLL